MASLMGGIAEVQEAQAGGNPQHRCALDFLLFRDIVQDHTAELQQVCAYYGCAYYGGTYCGFAYYGGTHYGFAHCGFAYHGCTYCGGTYYGCTHYGCAYHRRAPRSMTRMPTGAMGGTRWSPWASTA